jgi:hypothetical protein
MVKFESVPTGQIPNRAIVYRAHEFSFDVEPTPIRGFTSFLVNELSLEVDEKGDLLSIWGLCPHPGWQRDAVHPPEAPRGAVKISADSELSRGISLSLNKGNRWPAVYDDASGWLAVGYPNEARVFVEFVSGAILGLSDKGEFRSLWLKAAGGL